MVHRPSTNVLDTSIHPPLADFADDAFAVCFYWTGSGSADLSACRSGFPPCAPKNAARKMGHLWFFRSLDSRYSTVTDFARLRG
jgi:hypothetical protein